MKAPVIIFAYNRPGHLRRTLASLAHNIGAEDTSLYIYCDGPRHKAEEKATSAVRAVAKQCTGFADVQVIEREENYGLSDSVIGGVTEQLKQNEQIIVLEDDMVTSHFFLKYMNDALELYADNERVISIHGYIYPIQSQLPRTFFLRGADCWGWATWQRGWAHFNPNGQQLLAELQARNLLVTFDMDGAYSFSKMLRDQIHGHVDSWAIRWHASAFLANKLTLYPGDSLVHNIGNDASGVHSMPTHKYDVAISSHPIHLDHIPIEHSVFAWNEIKKFLLDRKDGKRDIEYMFNKLFNLINRFSF